MDCVCTITGRFLSLIEVLCSPMLLSTFSHFSLFHMAANMYVLWSFSSSIVNILGQEQFMAVYLSAGNQLSSWACPEFKCSHLSGEGTKGMITATFYIQ